MHTEGQIFNLFPEPVGVYSLSRKFTTEELSYINSTLLKPKENKLNYRSFESYALNEPILKNINDFCLSSLHHFQETIEGSYTPLRITQSWLNLTKKGQAHHRHVHPNSYISGVLFIDCEKSDKILFSKQTGQDVYYQSTMNKTYNPWNSTSWFLPASNGTLLLFRSSLNHEVPATVSERRVSLSFNSFFSKSYGTVEELNFLDF